jgi:DNA-binding LytR/AlgR family response regulator
MLYPKTVKQLKKFTFVIIDENQINALKTKAVAESFQNLHYLAMADSYDDGLDVILEYHPDIVFLEIDPQDKETKLSLALINELHRYLTFIPKVFVTTIHDALCLEAIKYGVFDYFIKPIEAKELRKTLFRLEKETEFLNIPVSNVITTVVSESSESTNKIIEINSISEVSNIELIDSVETKTDEIINDEVLQEQEVVEVPSELETPEPIALLHEENSSEIIENKEVTFLQSDNPKGKPLVICVKSYGDYRYIDATDICFLQADNNSTDIHLNTGEMITAFKTLKHFEGVLTYPFVRIHNSYIVNTDFVSRIHTGNAVCHIKNTTTKLPFSKSYKENIDAIITTIASGNYLEI